MLNVNFKDFSFCIYQSIYIWLLLLYNIIYYARDVQYYWYKTLPLYWASRCYWNAALTTGYEPTCTMQKKLILTFNILGGYVSFRPYSSLWAHRFLHLNTLTQFQEKCKTSDNYCVCQKKVVSLQRKFEYGLWADKLK